MNFLQRYKAIRERYRHPKNILASGFVIAISFGISVFLGYQALTIVQKARSLSQEVGFLQGRMRELERESVHLDKEIVALYSPDLVEKLAKAQLNLQKPEEEVAVVVPSTSTTTAPPGETKSLWERVRVFLDSFFR